LTSLIAKVQEKRGIAMLRKRLTFGSIGAVACAGGLAVALFAASGSAASAASGAQRAGLARLRADAGALVPSSLQPPAGNVLSAEFLGRGVQAYECTAGAWVFLEPAANLVGYATASSGIRTAIHYKGPTWESTTDGSLVQGTAIASVPVPGSIPELLLQATVNRGTGIFGTVTYINRLDTTGGAAPSGSCTSGQTIGVPYTAAYLFYVPSGS
jgi:hypothetical protein